MVSAAAKKSDGESRAEEKKAPPSSLEEQLDKAESAVTRARDATAQLHKQWRDHMLRISLLVIVLAFSQCRQPMRECMNNIKARTCTVSNKRVDWR